MAFHQHSLGLFNRHSLFQVVQVTELALTGSIGREQLSEPPLGHLEHGQGLDEELGCRLGDALQLLGGSVGLEHVQQHDVVDSG